MELERIQSIKDAFVMHPKMNSRDVVVYKGCKFMISCYHKNFKGVSQKSTFDEVTEVSMTETNEEILSFLNEVLEELYNKAEFINIIVHFA